MPVIVIANPKGGVGKSTLSTNLAGYFAAQGQQVLLGDTDRQQSARGWLGIRPPAARPISTWEIDEDNIARPPKGVSHVVLDTPAGLHGRRLNDILKLADKVIVPLQPSMFDILATREFMLRLADEKAVRKGDIEVGVVGMRVDSRTRSAEQLHRFVESLHLPMLGYLRDTQNYVQLAAHGLTLWDIAPSRVQRDVEQWQPILNWLAGIAPAAAPSSPSAAAPEATSKPIETAA
ncbi:ParA family protein [Oxalobacteraceae bacterium CAVE-383]|nr:ParA family protein [Oxalobacteraceae bacterium CAVE-383]